jgi:hypothetical protein
MSTRSFIALVTSEGYRSIYCHTDGHPDHNGRILRDAYADPARVEALIGLGNLAQLGLVIGQRHEVANHDRDFPERCLAYGRDGGEADQEAAEDPTFDDLVTSAREADAEWLYIFAPLGGGWFCVDLRSDEPASRINPRPIAEMNLAAAPRPAWPTG